MPKAKKKFEPNNKQKTVKKNQIIALRRFELGIFGPTRTKYTTTPQANFLNDALTNIINHNKC